MEKDDKNGWDLLFECLEKFSEDFMEERMQPEQKREEVPETLKLLPLLS